jgi:hypothetical protein
MGPHVDRRAGSTGEEEMLTFQENFYSHRLPPLNVTAIAQTPTPTQAQLEEIMAALDTAATAYTTRQYQNAIDAYQHAATLIYKFLVPGAPVGPQYTYTRDPRLFDAVLSASVEWLNMIPPTPDPPVESRVPVDRQLLGASAQYMSLGLHGPAVKRTSPGNVSRGAGAADPDAEHVGTEHVGTEGAGTNLHASPHAAAVRSYSTLVGTKPVSFDWVAGGAPPAADLKVSYYASRASVVTLDGLTLALQSYADASLSLPHAYYYTIPLGLGESYAALGDYAKAETEFFAVAGYPYINTAIEVPYVWQRLASLYLDWGNSLFRTDQAQAAMPIYQNVLNPDNSAPHSKLYTVPGLKPAADVGAQILAKLDQIIATPALITQLGFNPVTAGILVEIKQQLIKIQGGLDFWGHWHNTVPIWTFQYLQTTAVNFAQLAMASERDVMSYWERADQGTLTRDQLTTGLAAANAEVQAANLQTKAALAEAKAYGDGLALANRRAADATANASEYAATSAQAIVHQALQAQLNGGEDGDASQLNALADQMTSGSYSISGDRGTLSAAEQLSASRLNREYEVDSMHRTAAELAQAAVQAQSELAAANARAAASQAGAAAAQVRANGAAQMLQAFDSQTFTPDVWKRLGDAQWQLYQRYLVMAVKIAKLMQQAYNFETDQSLSLIRPDYSSGAGIVNGFLGADQLMADVQTFTYDLITQQMSKPQPIRQTISLAEKYPYLFENQFRKTGVMDFETRIDDFDTQFPGTYAGRIDAVEVTVDGIIPSSGLSGTLENSGISTYRVPASAWGQNPNGLKFRVQNRETLVLSDYGARNDMLLSPADTRMMGIFQGAGTASTWTLSLPRGVNDLDYGALLDVRLTFYYKARFDPDLKTEVLNTLATRPGFTARQRGIPLRWLYPDSFFRFQETGVLDLSLAARDFPYNQVQPVLTDVGVQLATDGSVPPGGLKVGLATPAHGTPMTATLDASGAHSSGGASAWTAQADGTAIGAYALTMTGADNPALVTGGTFDLDPIVNIALIVGYTFTPRT